MLPPPPVPDWEDHTITAQLVGALPPELRRYATNGVVDYDGPRVLAEFVAITNPNAISKHLAPAILRLAARAKRECSKRIPLLVVVYPGAGSSVGEDLALHRLIADADMVGVTLYLTQDARRAAEAIAALERGDHPR